MYCNDVVLYRFYHMYCFLNSRSLSFQAVGSTTDLSGAFYYLHLNKFCRLLLLFLGTTNSPFVLMCH